MMKNLLWGSMGVWTAVVLSVVRGSAWAQDRPAPVESRPADATPSPRMPEKPTERDVERVFVGLETIGVLDHYRKLTPADAAWFTDGESTIDAGMRLWHGLSTRMPKSRVAAYGRSAERKGCKDPLVMFFAAWASDQDQYLPATEVKLREAEGSFEGSGYPRVFLGAIRCRRGWCLSQQDKDAEAQAEFAEGIRDCAAWLAEASAAGMEPRYLLLHTQWLVEEYLPTEVSRRLVDAIEADTGVNRWLAATLDGVWEVRAAWEARGTGFADTVTRTGWKGFAEHLAAARKSLTRAYGLDARNPEAPSLMIRVAMGESTEDEEKLWFDRATGAQIDYMPAYNEYFWALRPRWGGSHEQMRALGEWCRSTGRYDTNVPFQYLRAINDIMEETRDVKTGWGDPGVFAVSMEVLEKSAQGAWQEDTREWYRGVAVAVCWWAGRPRDGFAILEKLKYRFKDEDAVKWTRGVAEIVLRDTLTFGGPEADLYDRAAGAIGDKDYEGAAGLAEEAARKCQDKPPPIRKAAESRKASTRMVADFEKGDWVELRPGPQNPGWRRVWGNWSDLPDGKGVDYKPGRGYLEATTFAKLGRRLEMETTIRFPRSPQKKTSGGIVLGYEWYTGATSRMQSIALEPATGLVHIGPGAMSKTAQTAKFEFTPGSDVHLLVQLWDDGVTVYADGKPVYRGQIPASQDGWVPGECVGLWASNEEVELRDVRLRKLSAAPGKPPKF